MGIRQLFAAITVCLTLTFGIANARPLSLNEITEGVCRVTARTTGSALFGGASAQMGSGTVVSETATSYQVLTNAHVVGNANSVTLEFWRGGRKTSPLTANVVWRQLVDGVDIDFAICEIDKSLFGNYPPRIIPLAPQDYQPQAGYYICAVGCDSGRWARGWEGYLDTDENTRVIFTPAPIGGQSGSGVMVLIPDKNGELHTRVGALLTWRTGHATSEEQASGAAIPVSRLYQVLAGDTTSNKIPVSWQPVAREAHAAIAKGSNGVLYETFIENGGVHCIHPGGVTIVDWNYNKLCNCPYCGRNHAPYNTPVPDTTQGPFNGRFNPFSSPAPNPNPGQGPTNPGPGANPYGVVPPNIGAPWPGANNTPNITPNDSEKQPATTVASGFFARIGTKLSGFGGGLAAGLGLWALGLFWAKFLRKRVIQGVDSVQDRIQAVIAKKYGKEAGIHARELMEGVEDSLLAVVETVIESRHLQQQATVSQMKGKIANRVTNGETELMKATKTQLLAAMTQAAKEVDDPSSPVNAQNFPERAKEILREAAL